MQKWKDEQEYVDCVLSQVRWKAAHDIIRTELSNHIADQREAFLEAGNTQAVAEQLAIAEMGEGLSVGIAFDKAYRPKVDWVILVTTLGLLGLGIFADLFSGQELIVQDFLILVLSGGILLAGCVWDYRRLFLYAYPLYFGFMIVFAGICLFGVRVNGRHAWLTIAGLISIRELLMLFPIVYSLLIYKMRNKGMVGLLLCGIMAAIPFLWATWSGERAALVIPSIACFAMLFMAVKQGFFGSHKKWAYGILGLPIAFALWFVCHAPGRLIYRLNPWLDPNGHGYQGSMLQTAFVNAQWIGTGDRASYNQFVQTVPDSQRYFALAGLTQYFGVIIFLLATCVIFVLLFRSNLISKKQKSTEGKLIATAALAVLGTSFVFGLFANVGILLIPSIALPLIAGGACMTLVYLLYIGVLLSVLRNTPLTHSRRNETDVAIDHESRLSIKDGVLTFRFKD